MTIKKFQGRTEEEATAKAKEEFGPQTVIMNVKEVKPKGFLRSFKTSVFEVTAAIEEMEQPSAAKIPAPLPPAPGNINIAADEPIAIPKPEPVKEMFASVENTWASSMGVQPQIPNTEEKKKENAVENNLEEKLESLQSLLEEKLSPQQPEELPKEAPVDENFKFIKMIYSILLDNEVDEKYVNQIMDEVEKVMKGGASVDLILSSIYQKMILKFGQPQPVELSERKPKVVFFIGPTGVGKTTTIAKIASRFKMEKGKKVALFTADTYRIAAAEQLRTYANIMDTPLNIVYSSEELNEEIKKSEEYDLVLIDTAGFSHKNEEQRNETKELIDRIPGEYQKEVYLVLSATTKYRDLIDIADIYKKNFQFKLIFTKLDETSCYGNILNMKLYTGADLSYSTYGQNVPEDIEIFNTQKIVKHLLGGK
ncbi:MAG: flagellar biosynthesis protein FlhF [Lachnospiraceae bacterium]|jgi:flagellar biosynthesis protein FlhF|nr:flagellar biosynthesis protein FlhF [Lachnospiraceae bacterium]MCI8873449.1 flagellar biosynthesis protein FlhF [Lachnospiraceae bacterium]MCI9058874.1 flagellar biosynthesis protein FlhF [Lachnospiraceae bacterium]GFI29061.1 flagellar biosynthesis protein FlhF [Lachnospiraceae bacterium]